MRRPWEQTGAILVSGKMGPLEGMYVRSLCGWERETESRVREKGREMVVGQLSEPLRSHSDISTSRPIVVHKCA